VEWRDVPSSSSFTIREIICPFFSPFNARARSSSGPDDGRGQQFPAESSGPLFYFTPRTRSFRPISFSFSPVTSSSHPLLLPTDPAGSTRQLVRLMACRYRADPDLMGQLFARPIYRFLSSFSNREGGTGRSSGKSFHCRTISRPIRPNPLYNTRAFVVYTNGHWRTQYRS